MIREAPRTSGVYQIRCIPNGKIYVGSAVGLQHRWHEHRQRLRNSTHRNVHLQNAWHKYGENAFAFEILEFVERVNLLKAEQKWIDETRCTNRDIGFNLYGTAGSPGDTFVQIWDGFIDPDGNEVTITNLYDFCRRHDLDWPSMHRLATGKSKLKSYKGWTHKNSVRQRDYVKTYEGFIDPEGNRVGPITNLAAFCRENGLDDTHMVAVAHGRLYSHRGWTYANGREFLGHRTYRGFINPNGERIIITNLNEFCRAHDLTSIHMRQLITGERKSHKGWTWKAEDERN